MAWIEAFMNNKGGSGKSAEAVAVAAALARSGRKVGFADLDAQGNATRRLGIDKAGLIAADRPGIAELLDPKRPAHIADVAVPCGWDEPWAANILVLPSLDRESLAERAEEAARPGAAGRLSRALGNDGWADGLHDVVIDTGPGVDHLLHMAMHAADHAVLVSEMKKDSIEGALYLAGYVDFLRGNGVIDMTLAGLVVNAYDKDSARQVKHFSGLGEMFATWGGWGLVWDPAVPFRLSLASAHEDAVSVDAIRHVSAVDLAPVYDEHADRLIAIQEGTPA